MGTSFYEGLGGKLTEHIPVLLEPIMNMAQGLSRQPQYYLDGTFGRGGHTRVLLNEYPQLKAIGLDQDAEAIQFGEKNFAEEIAQGRFRLIQINFNHVDDLSDELNEFHGGNGIDLILLDLGVSSPQLESEHRGFSFYQNGPLDMRMDQRQELTASTIVNEWSSENLLELFRCLGEVRRPGRVVKRIVEERKKHSFQTTRGLASLIERCEGWRKKGCHPATQYFLALRLEVNRELDVIKEVIPKMVDLLSMGGRLMIITFHSLEDRIVKHALYGLKSRGSLVNKKVIQAQWSEKKKNPRARSAKLRAFQKGVP